MRKCSKVFQIRSQSHKIRVLIVLRAMMHLNREEMKTDEHQTIGIIAILLKLMKKREGEKAIT